MYKTTQGDYSPYSGRGQCYYKGTKPVYVVEFDCQGETTDVAFFRKMDAVAFEGWVKMTGYDGMGDPEMCWRQCDVTRNHTPWDRSADHEFGYPFNPPTAMMV